MRKTKAEIQEFTYGEESPSSGRRGRPFKPRPWADDLRRLYIQEGKTIRETADALGVSKDLVFRALREAGLELRPRTRKPGLLKVPPAQVLTAVIDQGAEGAADALGVSRRTLYRNLRRIKGRP